MPNYWKIRAGERGRHWKFWKTKEIISIGWNIGRLEELTLEETIRKIEESYPNNDPYQVASMIRRFAGVAEGKPCISKGDIIIVLGDAEVLDIAEAKEEEYHYEPQGIPAGKTHTYWRAVEYRNYEHVKLRDLPPKFQQKGNATLHSPRTIMLYRYGEDNISDLEQIMKEGFGQTTNAYVPRTKISDEIYDRIWKLLLRKKQVILYGPPGTGKTWLAKKFVEEYYRRNAPSNKKLATPRDIVLSDFQGFTVDSFEFFKNLGKHNTKEWMHTHMGDFRKHVDIPLRTITKVTGEYVKKLDTNFETKADSLNTISRINKNIYGQKDVELYHTHMWSAFYRKKIGDKRKDAQLFVIINQDNVHFGFGFGNYKEAQVIETKFKKNVTEEVDFFFETLDNLKILGNFNFRYHDKQGIPHVFNVKTLAQLQEWLEKDNIDIVKIFSDNDLPLQGSEQAREIIQTFQTLYPIYLFATTENPREKIEDYLEGMGEEDPDTLMKQLVRFVTFHQSYSYEEFVEGIRPDLGGKEEGEPMYRLAEGVFKKICSEAGDNEENAYFLIIDEINRGNISKIFGELITCLEKDKRLGPGNIEQENTFPMLLPYSKEPLLVPWNLYVIGTMNTADKSIALVDVALRRRFGFLEVAPEVSLVKPINILGIEVRLPEILGSLNEKISILIDQDHKIGHSYLMNIERNPEGQVTKDPETIMENLKLVFYNEIFPLVLEYFYNDWEKIQLLLGDFVKVEKTLEDAQGIVDDANQGIYSVKKLDGEEFLKALNRLTESGKLAE